MTYFKKIIEIIQISPVGAKSYIFIYSPDLRITTLLDVEISILSVVSKISVSKSNELIA